MVRCACLDSLQQAEQPGAPPGATDARCTLGLTVRRLKLSVEKSWPLPAMVRVRPGSVTHSWLRQSSTKTDQNLFASVGSLARVFWSRCSGAKRPQHPASTELLAARCLMPHQLHLQHKPYAKRLMDPSPIGVTHELTPPIYAYPGEIQALNVDEHHREVKSTPRHRHLRRDPSQRHHACSARKYSPPPRDDTAEGHEHWGATFAAASARRASGAKPRHFL
jgi:hypothetical protein